MTLSFDIPEHVGDVLRTAYGDNLNRAALEAIAIEGYRSGKLSQFEVQQILGFDNRWDTDEWLGAHGAHLQYSLADLEADRRTLDQLLGPAKP